MAFFSKKSTGPHSRGQKIPPVGAWKHYSKKQKAKNLTVQSDTNKNELLISVENLSLAYDGRTVITDLSFFVNSGDYISIIGENGSGKSSLMNAILGMLKPVGGNIRFNNLTRKQIGVLPQQMPVESDFPATVSEIVLSGSLSRSKKGPFLSKDSKELAFSSMEKLGITSLSARPYRELSGGQRQRVLIARALCAAEKMLILDEPVTGLDVGTTADIYALFRDLNTLGTTILTVTHDVRSAIKYSNKILRINKDSIFFGTVEEYKQLPEAEQYISGTNNEDTAQALYGDGGFRYNGGTL